MCSPSWLFRDEKHINVICYNTIFCTVVQAFCPQTVYKTGKIRVCGAMKSPVGTLSDRTVLCEQDGGALPRQVLPKYSASVRPFRAAGVLSKAIAEKAPAVFGWRGLFWLPCKKNQEKPCRRFRVDKWGDFVILKGKTER